MIEYMSLLQLQFPLTVLGFTAVIGLIIGSFLNVVMYRLPGMLERELAGDEDSTVRFNLVFPHSHCPACKAGIKPWNNIPVISYFLLGRKCADCGAPIPARYPIIEIATGILTVVVIHTLGLNPIGISGCLLTWALISLAVIDYDTQLLPDNITLPFLWLGLMVNFFDTIVDFRSAFIGACVGYLALWIVYRLFKLITGKEGMGYGDFKLLAMLGAWLGWQFLPLVIIVSSFAGIVITGFLIARGRDRTKPIPFGPYLAMAGWVALLYGDTIMFWYSGWAAGMN